jgi:hypothetical protein
MPGPSPANAVWMRARAAGEPADLFTATIEHRREHPFKDRKPKLKCARCELPKAWPGHHGYPPSLNAGGSGTNYGVYQNTKQLWQSILTPLIEEAGLPLGLGRVYVEAVVCFPTRARRDQGNFRVYLEKALGDALVEGGWLEDDDWSRYEFGALRQAYEKGEAWTRVTLIPSWDTPVVTVPADVSAAVEAQEVLIHD